MAKKKDTNTTVAKKTIKNQLKYTEFLNFKPEFITLS
jgi:hypothetical protein